MNGTVIDSYRYQHQAEHAMIMMRQMIKDAFTKDPAAVIFIDGSNEQLKPEDWK